MGWIEVVLVSYTESIIWKNEELNSYFEKQFSLFEKRIIYSKNEFKSEYKKVDFLIRKTNSKNEFKKWICEKWISEFEKRNFFIQKRISYSKNEFLIQKMKLVFCWMKEFIPKEYNLDFMNSRFLKWFIMILLDKELIILEMISKHEMGHFHPPLL